VENVLSMNDAIYIIEKAFTDLANGRAVMPLRTPIQVPQHNGLALFMPAYLEGMGALGTKVVTVYRDNLVKYDLPTVLGTILLFDEKNGVPLAIMEAGFLTAMRTGAVSGLATRRPRQCTRAHNVRHGRNGPCPRLGGRLRPPRGKTDPLLNRFIGDTSDLP